MLRPLALLKGGILLLVHEETICVRRTKTFTQDKTARNLPRKWWRAEGKFVGQRQESRCAAAGTVERHRAAAAITIQHAEVHRGHTCPLCVLLPSFPTREKKVGARGRSPRRAVYRDAVSIQRSAETASPQKSHCSSYPTPRIKFKLSRQFSLTFTQVWR